MAEKPPVMDEGYWRRFLLEGGDTWKGVGRRVLKHIPADPRCRMCASPFTGLGGPIMRMVGKRPSDANPNWCTSCFSFLSKHRGGAEVPGALMFADIRGSTALAERMSPGEFHALLNRFLSTASSAVFRHDGFVDKFVGDELVAIFFPVLSGDRYVARAVSSAEDLLRATGHEDPDGPWAPVGVGLHAGQVWFGVVGEGSHVELTAVGDNVNIAARLAGEARTGEVLLSTDAAAEAALDTTGLERRMVELKGKERPMEVLSLSVRPIAV